MIKKSKYIFFALLLAAVIAGAALFIRSSDIAVLNPKGIIANQQRDLMVTATLLMLIVVIPVFILTFTIAWRYREGNQKAVYKPDWDHHRLVEVLWWTIPAAIITVLSVITWRSSHELDPFRPLASNQKPITIQVVALQWKWLFIYPDQAIATVNYVQFPAGTPVNFEITADAPMNSFWIPSLGGQIYAMAGMSTKLHLMADQPGSFNGSSANLSGDGFAGMKFTAQSSSKTDFDKWIRSVKKSPQNLTLAEYAKLSEPSKNNSVTSYIVKDQDLYDKVMMKYMAPVPYDQHKGHY